MGKDKGFFARYFLMECKRGLWYLPRMLVGILVFMVVIGGFLYAAGKWMMDFQQKQKITLAVSLPEDGAAEKWMMSILGEMESVKENCNLIETSEQEAMNMLAEDQAAGAIIIPAGFVRGIMTGKNIPADIYLPNSPLQKDLVLTLTKAGAQSLAASQAGIYAMSDFAISQHKQSALSKIGEDLNQSYIRFTLKRPHYFSHVSLANANALSIQKQYTASGITLFLLLCLLSMAKFLSGYSRAMGAKLAIKGVTPPVVVVAQTAVVWILLSILGLGILVALLIFGSKMMHWKMDLLPGILGMLGLAAAVAPFGIFVYTAAGSKHGAMLYLFLASVWMLFLSGGFLPLYLLPKIIEDISHFVPTTAMLKSVSMVFGTDSGGLLGCFLWGALFLVFAMVVAVRRYRQEGGARI